MASRVVSAPLAVRRRRRLAGLLAALAALAALAGGWLWLRDSPLVAVEDVFITGVSSSEEPEIRRALRDAAQDMTTLHVREDALEAAVASFPSVAGVRADADLPHKLTIEVLERVPVAALDTGARRVPATGGGLLLHGLEAEPALPVLSVRSIPGGERVRAPRPRAALAVAGAAPPALRARVERLDFDQRGLVLALRDGPELVFGSDADARAKWAAAARVLADPSAQGATYLDLRVPERVAAGGLGPVEPTLEPTPTPVP